MNKSRLLNLPLTHVSSSLDFLSGGGNMGEVIRNINWDYSSLGALITWPHTLRVAVSIMLNSSSPVFITWGSSQIFLFNDAYLPILGERGADPALAMGKPFATLWPDIWDDIKPLVDIAMSGRSIGFEDAPFVLQRNSNPEQTYFTFTYTPIRGDKGLVNGMFCTLIETTEKVFALRQLTSSNTKLQQATDAAEIGFFENDLKADVIDMDLRAKRYFGLSQDANFTLEIMQRALHPDDRIRMKKHLSSLLKGEIGDYYKAEYRTIGVEDGKLRWIDARGRLYFDELGVPSRLIGTLMDITERKATEKLMKESAQHDSLTGLPNRGLLFEYTEHLLAAADRSKACSAVLFIDLDRFKPINDLHGHDIGDKVLQEVARRLLLCTRKEDIVSRLGGDEFIVVLPRIRSTENPAKLAQYIIDTIGKPIHIDSLLLHVSPSIGISIFKKDANNLETLIRYADLAMYAAKKAGRNTYRFYMQELDKSANERLLIEA